MSKVITLMVALLLIAGLATAEVFWLEVDGCNVTVGNENAEFNCGSVLYGDMEIVDWTVRLFEIEDLVDPQYCICLFDMKFHFQVSEPGEYQLEFWRVPWDGQPFVIWEAGFLVIEGGIPGEVLVQQSECGGWTTALPEGQPMEATFSMIRSLY